MTARRLMATVGGLAIFICCPRGPSPEDMQRSKDRAAIGVDHMNSGRFREALGELMQAQELNPQDPEVQYAMGLVYVYGFKR
jgi:Tfp pilus assembly protein PilF